MDQNPQETTEAEQNSTNIESSREAPQSQAQAAQAPLVQEGHNRDQEWDSRFYNSYVPPPPSIRTRRRIYSSAENWGGWPWQNEVEPLPQFQRAFWKSAIYSFEKQKFDPDFIDAFLIDYAPRRGTAIINWAIKISPSLSEDYLLQTSICAYIDEIRFEIKNDLKNGAILSQSQRKEIYEAAHAINAEFRALM